MYFAYTSRQRETYTNTSTLTVCVCVCYCIIIVFRWASQYASYSMPDHKNNFCKQSFPCESEDALEKLVLFVVVVVAKRAARNDYVCYFAMKHRAVYSFFLSTKLWFKPIQSPSWKKLLSKSADWQSTIYSDSMPIPQINRLSALIQSFLIFTRVEPKTYFLLRLTNRYENTYSHLQYTKGRRKIRIDQLWNQFEKHFSCCAKIAPHW